MLLHLFLNYLNYSYLTMARPEEGVVYDAVLRFQTEVDEDSVRLHSLHVLYKVFFTIAQEECL